MERPRERRGNWTVNDERHGTTPSMTSKRTLHLPDDDARQELVHRPTSNTTEPNGAADKHRNQSHEQWRTPQDCEPAPPPPPRERDQQRRLHVAEQAGAAYRREPVATTGLVAHGCASELESGSCASTARDAPDAATFTADAATSPVASGTD